MATVINLPKDPSFFGGGGAEAIGSIFSNTINSAIQQKRRDEQTKQQVAAIQKAFDPQAIDSDVASNLAVAGVEADMIAKIIMERQKAAKEDITYEKVTGYKQTPGGQAERAFFVPKSKLSDVESFLQSSGYTSVKMPTVEADKTTESEREVMDEIKAYGGDPNNPNTRSIGRQLVKNRNAITEQIAKSFNATFMGDGFSFDQKEDSQRFNLANAMVPRIMMYEGKEQGIAIKEAVELANKMIPETDILEDVKKEKPEESKTKETKTGFLDTLTGIFSTPEKEKEQLGTYVSGANNNPIPLEVSKESMQKAENGDPRLLVQELTSILGSQDAAVKWLEDNGFIAD